MKPEGRPALAIDLVSFGHKHGPPPVADLVLDARVLPNPYYVGQLKPLAGTEPLVAAHVLDHPLGREFLARTLALLELVIDRYQEMARPALTIGVGCTGGRHRSVAVAEALARGLAHRGRVRVAHRDLGKG